MLPALFDITTQLAHFAFGVPSAADKTLKSVLQTQYSLDDLRAFAKEPQKLSIYELALLVHLFLQQYSIHEDKHLVGSCLLSLAHRLHTLKSCSTKQLDELVDILQRHPDGRQCAAFLHKKNEPETAVPDETYGQKVWLQLAKNYSLVRFLGSNDFQKTLMSEVLSEWVKEADFTSKSCISSICLVVELVLPHDPHSLEPINTFENIPHAFFDPAVCMSILSNKKASLSAKLTLIKVILLKQIALPVPFLHSLLFALAEDVRSSNGQGQVQLQRLVNCIIIKPWLLDNKVMYIGSTAEITTHYAELLRGLIEQSVAQLANEMYPADEEKRNDLLDSIKDKYICSMLATLKSCIMESSKVPSLPTPKLKRKSARAPGSQLEVEEEPPLRRGFLLARIAPRVILIKAASLQCIFSIYSTIQNAAIRQGSFNQLLLDLREIQGKDSPHEFIINKFDKNGKSRLGFTYCGETFIIEKP